MKVYHTTLGLILEQDGQHCALNNLTILDLFRAEDAAALLRQRSITAERVPAPNSANLLAPLDLQEVWAAGVTYYRSRNARMEESQSSGGGDFYAKVYEAERPELFFKATPHRVAPPGGAVAIRSDSTWDVPEPELTLAVNTHGKIFGFTIGNDMSSRSIEGVNPLYLPQAKVYDRCASLGPCLLIQSTPLPAESEIGVCIRRAKQEVFRGATQLKNMKRTPEELVGFLLRHQTFPEGVFLMTGTGVVPPNDFTLQAGDEIAIHIAGIGELLNVVA